jgi:enolase
MSLTVKDLKIRKVLDSRGNATVEVELFYDDKSVVCSAPSGASRGIYEVTAYPEGEISKGIETFNKFLKPKLVGYYFSTLSEIDTLLHELDRTERFEKIGGNIAVSVSIASAKAFASLDALPLYRYFAKLIFGTEKKFEYTMPALFGNVLGGGRHAIHGTDIQEFLAVPLDKNVDFTNIPFVLMKVHKKVGGKLKAGLSTAIGKGDEGAWVACIKDEEALKIVSNSCTEISNEFNVCIKPALDVAASELYKKGRYRYRDKVLSNSEQIELIKNFIVKYGLCSVEDPFEQNDFESYALLTKDVGKQCLIVGDDLFVTNLKRLEKGIKMNACNAILIKPNQVGTLTDTISTIKVAHQKGFKTIISHRSGETLDTTISHLAVGSKSFGIKCGCVGGERIAKLNELIRIYDDLKSSSTQYTQEKK